MRGPLLLALLCAGCLRQIEFHCESNEQCSPNGICQAIGYCSFPDSECGQRFSSYAGPYANQCVDIPSETCPTNYAPLLGAAVGSNVYWRLPMNASWDALRTACKLTSTKAYLAVPNDAEELTELATVAGAAPFWIGINDREIEGMYIQESGGPAQFLPWATGEPDNAGGGEGQDCVAATRTNITDEACTGGANHPGVCECEP